MKIVLRWDDCYEGGFETYDKDVLKCQIISEYFKTEFEMYNKFRNGFYLAWFDGDEVKKPWKLINGNTDEN